LKFSREHIAVERVEGSRNKAEEEEVAGIADNSEREAFHSVAEVRTTLVDSFAIADIRTGERNKGFGGGKREEADSKPKEKKDVAAMR